MSKQPHIMKKSLGALLVFGVIFLGAIPVSYTHLRAHETVLDIVCRLLLEKKKKSKKKKKNRKNINNKKTRCSKYYTRTTH